MNYRATPHPTTGVSPARLFFNREIQTPQLKSLEKFDHNHEAELSNHYNSMKIKEYADHFKHVKQERF